MKNDIKINFIENEMILESSGSLYRLKIEDISKKLFYASKSEREKFEISPSGYGIHWGIIDEDLSVKGLIKKYNEIHHSEEIK